MEKLQDDNKMYLKKDVYSELCNECEIKASELNLFNMNFYGKSICSKGGKSHYRLTSMAHASFCSSGVDYLNIT